jgi:hypothetical protein
VRGGRSAAGALVAAVAEDLGVSLWTVRRRWRRSRVGGAAVAWVIREAPGTVVRTHPAPEVRRERLLALDIAQRHPRRPAPAQPPDRPPEGQPYSR